jgi:hypothetical protein
MPTMLYTPCPVCEHPEMEVCNLANYVALMCHACLCTVPLSSYLNPREVRATWTPPTSDETSASPRPTLQRPISTVSTG